MASRISTEFRDVYGELAKPPMWRVVQATLDHASFTDGGGASGTYTIADTLPAGAVVMGVEMNTTEAWTDDATELLSIGYTGSAAAFCGGSGIDVSATGYDYAVPSTTAGYCSAVTSILATMTGGSDFGAITTGTTTVKIWWIQTR